MWRTESPTAPAAGRVFTEQRHLLTQKTNEEVPEKGELQTLIMRNKGNKNAWFYGNSLKYHSDVMKLLV